MGSCIPISAAHRLDACNALAPARARKPDTAHTAFVEAIVCRGTFEFRDVLNIMPRTASLCWHCTAALHPYDTTLILVTLTDNCHLVCLQLIELELQSSHGVSRQCKVICIGDLGLKHWLGT
jgi:hypothetical protein